MSDDINHLVYGLVMGGCGLVGIVVWWQTRENDDLSQEWRRYAVMVSSGLLVGSMDAFVPAFGERRLGFIVAVVVGVPAVVVCLRRALQLRHATTADWLDAVLIACSFCYLVWWYQVGPTEDLLQQAALLTFVFTTATFAALFLFAARDLHRVRPRAFTALGLAFQPFGVALAPQALDGAAYADNLIGSTVTLAGCVLLSTAMVVAANSNVLTTTAEVRRNDAWCGDRWPSPWLPS